MKTITFSTETGSTIKLTNTEAMALGWKAKEMIKAKKIEDYYVPLAHKIINNRPNIKEPPSYSFLDDQELAIYKHLLTDSERAEIEKSFEDHNQGKIIEIGKANKKGVCKGTVRVPVISRINSSEISRYIPKLSSVEISGDIVGEYIVSKGCWSWEISHIKTGFSILQTEKLRDYTRRNNGAAYSFKKAQAMEIAMWLVQQNLVIADNYNDLVKRVKSSRQEVIDNLVNVYASFVEDVAFRM